MTMQAKPPVKVLALDTSTRRGSVALLAGMDMAGELRLNSLETHSTRLLRSVSFLLEMTGWHLRDLGLVAAGLGPGSFTGIRIGVSTALGLAQTLRIPFAGVSGLDAVAGMIRRPGAAIGVVMDAQRSQVYFAEYDRPDGSPRSRRRPALWDPEDLALRLRNRHVYLVGDGIERMARTIVPGASWPRVLETELFIAGSIGRLALARKRTWRRGEFIGAEPLYIRPPDATRPKKRKE
jgi:tRNA threonylcarbamoyl adenosine modification protein YeaZ